MSSQKSMQTVDKITATISGVLAAGFFTLAVVAAIPGDEPPAPVIASSTRP